jgi:3-phosphoshikimate 1-carboxyvinyltransferase
MSAHSRRVPVLANPIDAVVRPPGSKSETIRALAAASLAEGRSHLYEPLQAEDSMAMAGALQALGIAIDTNVVPWSVDGRGGRLAAPERPLDANESGLSARILLAMTGNLDGTSRIVGHGRLPERPMGGIIEVLRAQGVEVTGQGLPIEVLGRGRLHGGHITVDCSQSSQFATAVMLVAPVMENPCVVEIRGLSGSANYLEGTVSIMRRFGAKVERTITGYEIANEGYQASDVFVEPDASAAVYPISVAAISGGRVTIDGLGEGTWQPDLGVASILETMGCHIEWESNRVTVDARGVSLRGVEVDMSHAPDGALALAVVCLFAESPSRISGLDSLRHKESDRLAAMASEIRRIDGQIDIEDDSISIHPADLKGAEIDPHGDHRIAMAMATAGTRLADLSVANPDVVNKTWPGFWDFLETFAPG